MIRRTLIGCVALAMLLAGCSPSDGSPVSAPSPAAPSSEAAPQQQAAEETSAPVADERASAGTDASAAEWISALDDLGFTSRSDYETWCEALYRGSGYLKTLGASEDGWSLDVFGNPGSGSELGGLHCNLTTDNSHTFYHIRASSDVYNAKDTFEYSAGLLANLDVESIDINASTLNGMQYARLDNRCLVDVLIASTSGVLDGRDDLAMEDLGTQAVVISVDGGLSIADGESPTDDDLLVEACTQLVEFVVSHQPQWGALDTLPLLANQ